MGGQGRGGIDDRGRIQRDDRVNVIEIDALFQNKRVSMVSNPNEDIHPCIGVKREGRWDPATGKAGNTIAEIVAIGIAGSRDIPSQCCPRCASVSRNFDKGIILIGFDFIPEIHLERVVSSDFEIIFGGQT